QNTIITDVRLNREAEYIKNRGGVIIEVVRNNTPKVENHITEQGIDKKLIDFSVLNDSLEGLQEQAEDIHFNIVEKISAELPQKRKAINEAVSLLNEIFNGKVNQ
ncbi:hypothetical protein H0A36_29590, partial [Endozoicomonas sp. SM1973]